MRSMQYIITNPPPHWTSHLLSNSHEKQSTHSSSTPTLTCRSIPAAINAVHAVELRSYFRAFAVPFGLVAAVVYLAGSCGVYAAGILDCRDVFIFPKLARMQRRERERECIIHIPPKFSLTPARTFPPVAFTRLMITRRGPWLPLQFPQLVGGAGGVSF